MNIFRVALTLWLASLSFGAQALIGVSARRQSGTSYLNYVHKHPTDEQQKDAYSSAVPFKSANLPAATEWNSATTMQTNFEQMRDVRWMTTSDHPGFLRRSSWLYPDDGCFARAALAIMNLALWKIAVPSKVFVFGDLDVKTKNSPTGEVSWWYHVAPIVQVGGQKFVLDPALEPQHPLKLEDWLALMSSTPGDLQVAICHSGTYSPYDVCGRDTDGKESAGQTDQIGYLNDEWSRLVELNRDPERELGDQPPWLSPGNPNP